MVYQYRKLTLYDAFLVIIRFFSTSRLLLLLFSRAVRTVDPGLIRLTGAEVIFVCD